MKKLIISLLLLAAVSFAANAQFYVGGLVGLDLTAPKNGTSFSFLVSPEAGYNLSEKIAVGASLNLNPSVSSYDGTSSSSFAWSLQPYARFKFVSIGKLNLFGDASVGLGTTGSSSKYEDVIIKSKAVFQWSVGFYPGISYDFAPKWSIVSRIAGISYGGSGGGNAFNLNILNRVSLGVFYTL